eukprot:scaffold4120_cov400-Prasinococcus_capsulatus_cf.AAC.7
MTCVGRRFAAHRKCHWGQGGLSSKYDLTGRVAVQRQHRVDEWPVHPIFSETFVGEDRMHCECSSASRQRAAYHGQACRVQKPAQPQGHNAGAAIG